jgi:hypothetical protein
MESSWPSDASDRRSLTQLGLEDQLSVICVENKGHCVLGAASENLEGDTPRATSCPYGVGHGLTLRAAKGKNSY